MGELEATATKLDVSRLADEAITEFLQAADVGDAPSRSEFIRRHQNVRSALESFFDVYDQMGGSLQSEETTSFVEGGQLGRHRLVRPIGAGAFGTVWLGFDTQLKRPVAIKVPKKDRFSSQKQRDLFLSEARTVAQLDHPNIIPIYDVGETEAGEIYLVSRFVAGNDLATEMRTRRFNPEEATRCISSIADALEYAHRRNVIHRDIKPSNILLDAETGQPYVTDFGLACNFDTARDASIAGTPTYMSPEQASGTKLDHRSDMFSVGVLFYELLFGTRPFSGKDAKDMMRAIREDSPHPPSDKSKNVSSQLQQVCLQTLARRPEGRFADMAEFRSALSPHFGSASSQQSKTAAGVGNRRQAAFGLIGLVAVLCLAYGVTKLASPTGAGDVQQPKSSTVTGTALDREIAEETIRLGGHIDVRFEGDDYEVDSIDDIPDGHISLLWVMFDNKQTLSDEYFDRLTQLDSLEGVDFFSCSFSDDAFARLGEIESLRVVHAPMTRVDTGVAALAKLPRLYRLTLTSTQISNETLKAFEGNSTLRQLRLSETSITDDALKTIGSFTALETLNLDVCRVTSAGIRHLSSLTTLTTLKLAQASIDDEALDYLDRCPIKHLVVSNPVSKEAEARFLEKHPGCRIIRD
ncbi:MAG: protein kinase [Planctomycetaceae bacterium]